MEMVILNMLQTTCCTTCRVGMSERMSEMYEIVQYVLGKKTFVESLAWEFLALRELWSH